MTNNFEFLSDFLRSCYFWRIHVFFGDNFGYLTTKLKNTNNFFDDKFEWQNDNLFALHPTTRMPEMIQIMASNCRKTYLKQYRHVVFKGWLGYSENIMENIISGKKRKRLRIVVASARGCWRLLCRDPWGIRLMPPMRTGAGQARFEYHFVTRVSLGCHFVTKNYVRERWVLKFCEKCTWAYHFVFAEWVPSPRAHTEPGFNRINAFFMPWWSL